MRAVLTPETCQKAEVFSSSGKGFDTKYLRLLDPTEGCSDEINCRVGNKLD